MGKRRPTRFDKIAPPPPPAKKAKARKPNDPDAWEQEARYRGWFPFERERYLERAYVHEEVVPVEEVEREREYLLRRRRVERSEVHQMTRLVMGNALLQAYISGYVDATRYLEELPFIIRQFSKSKRLQKAVRQLIDQIKEDLKSGRRTF